jgi:carbamoyl-phosphate synthase small subunit
MVSEVTCVNAYTWQGDAGSAWVPKKAHTNGHPLTIAVYDFGVKRNILRQLASYGAVVRVFGANTPASEVLATHPDGVFLSNGPGDPAGLPALVATTQELLKSGVPLFGICLGHQLIGRALGAQTQRLKFGHHGGNHPVLHLQTGKALITAQNHNYCVVPENLNPNEVEITYRSLNDHSLEGMRLKNKPVFSVQFHPEAAPGPHDGQGIFAEFIEMIRKEGKNAQAH